MSTRQAKSVAIVRLIGWHLSQPIGFLVALFSAVCRVTAHQRDISCYIAVRELLYLVAVLRAAHMCPAFLLLSLRTTWQTTSRWSRRLGYLCAYVFAPHHYVILCLWRCGALADVTARVVTVFMVVSDCFGLCSLGIFLKESSVVVPPKALLVGYSITAVGFAFATTIACMWSASNAVDTTLSKMARFCHALSALAVLILMLVVAWHYLLVVIVQ